MSQLIDGLRNGHDPHPVPSGDQGAVLSVVPIPGSDQALVIVGHMVPADGRAVPAAPAGGAAGRPPVREGDDLVVDRASRVGRVDGEEISLTYREFELLDYLRSSPGRVYNRRQLLAAVWDRYTDQGVRTVDVHVLRLRRKLGRHANRIVTVRNVGYKYQPPRRPGR